MKLFISPQYRPLLEGNELDSFDALWNLSLDSVDAPNVNRGGWSEVFRLEIEGQGYFLKRQSNHLTRNILPLLREPTFVREFRNLQRLQSHGVPTLEVVFFAHNPLPGDNRAILMTRELDGWFPFDYWLNNWSARPETLRSQLLAACGKLARQTYAAGLVHGCFYPKHVFLHPRQTDGGFDAALIDLEKAHPAWMHWHGISKDIGQFIRHSPGLSESDLNTLLAAWQNCPPDSAEVRRWRKVIQ